MITPSTLRLSGLIAQMHLLLTGTLICLLLLVALRVVAQPIGCDRAICSCAAMSGPTCPSGMDAMCKSVAAVTKEEPARLPPVWHALSPVETAEIATIAVSLVTRPDFPPPRNKPSGVNRA